MSTDRKRQLVPSMRRVGDAEPCNADELARYVQHFGRRGVMTLSTNGVRALAAGVEQLVQSMTEVALASSELRDLEAKLVGPGERAALKSGLDRIDAAIFGGTSTQEAKTDE